MRKDRLEEVDRAIQVYKLRRTALQERMAAEPEVLDGSRETGAVRRASLDLSLALAVLRRPDHG